MTFAEKEKKKHILKKYIKSHLFEFILDIIGPMLLTMLFLYLCKSENYIYGICLSVAYSFGKIIYRLHCFKKEFL